MRPEYRTKLFLAIVAAAACLSPALLNGRIQAQAGTVTGKWHFVLDTEGGPRDVDATFQQDGDKVTGKWGDKDDVKGTFADGKLSLSFTINSEEAGPGTLKLEGALANDALTGTWSFQTYDGSFKATRSKPATS